jgi:hypothetical protein
MCVSSAGLGHETAARGARKKKRKTSSAGSRFGVANALPKKKTLFISQVPKPPRLDPYDDRCASWADSDEEGDGSAAGDGSSGLPSSSSTPPPARPPPPSAAALAPAVDAAIARLGGRVLPKLNWSAPLDAAWMVPNNCIACENADEVREGETARIGRKI